MILSTKLLIASLGLSHLSGVAGTRGAKMKSEREQLKRRLRGDTAEGKRDLQFIWESEDIEASKGPDGYDDYFAVEETIDVVGPIADVDNFFEATDSGMVYDWDAATGTHSADGPAVGAGRIGNKSAKSGKYTKLGYTDSSGKIEKAAKVGKQMWDETPIMVKSAKSPKKFKSMKKKGKYVKSGKSYKAYYGAPTGSTGSAGSPRSHYYGDAHAPEPEPVGTSWLSGFTSGGSLGYNDLFAHGSVPVHHSDDFFAPMTRSVNGEDVTGRSGHTGPTFDDDFFSDQEQIVFLPRPVVTVSSSVFSQNPQNIMAPIVPDGSGNSLTIGTEYLYNEVLLDAQNINSRLVPLQVDNQEVLFNVAIDGYCDRIGPPDQNSVQGYCFFTYTFIEPSSQLTSGSFTAQGIIVNSEVPGQLTVTGGTGLMTGATGLVEILPAAIDQNINPPLLIQPAIGSDPFNGVAGWAHFFEFDVDVLFFLPELYSR